ncbi:MAG: hypothetical protein E6248_00315 [Clostridium sp.]|uniref:hypothetical protein n=1 Tax=Clostridium sp. TaxID=1506 RepID=UPI002913CB07|nr:hypothetical protein [Clostridium sp.]MDU5108859.1 hypothetical protein [Clostridium sp.]
MLYVAKIYALALLKISSGIGIYLLIILSLMAITRYLTKDKAIFTKQLIKLRRWVYGCNTITK